MHQLLHWLAERKNNNPLASVYNLCTRQQQHFCSCHYCIPLFHLAGTRETREHLALLHLFFFSFLFLPSPSEPFALPVTLLYASAWRRKRMKRNPSRVKSPSNTTVLMTRESPDEEAAIKTRLKVCRCTHTHTQHPHHSFILSQVALPYIPLECP